MSDIQSSEGRVDLDDLIDLAIDTKKAELSTDTPEPEPEITTDEEFEATIANARAMAQAMVGSTPEIDEEAVAAIKSARTPTTILPSPSGHWDVDLASAKAAVTRAERQLLAAQGAYISLLESQLG